MVQGRIAIVFEKFADDLERMRSGRWRFPKIDGKHQMFQKIQ
jgi:hypothetical protein